MSGGSEHGLGGTNDWFEIMFEEFGWRDQENEEIKNSKPRPLELIAITYSLLVPCVLLIRFNYTITLMIKSPIIESWYLNEYISNGEYLVNMHPL